MSTTGTYLFDPELAELFDEAFERAGVDPFKLENRHIAAAKRSTKFIFDEWNVLGVRQWQIQEHTVTLIPNQASFNLPIGALYVFDMVFVRNNIRTEVAPIARDVYYTKHKLDLRGRVIEYMLDRQASTKTVYIWPCGEISGDQLKMNYVRQMQDAGSLANTLQLPQHAREAYVAGLAAAMALKFNDKRYGVLNQEYRGPNPDKIGGKLQMMLDEDGEKVELVCQVDYTGPRQGSW